MDTRPSYKLLKTFTQTLLNNTANSGKTSDIALSVSLEEFKKHTEEQKEYNSYLIEEYMKNYDIPRKENEFAYTTYLADKENLKKEWKRTKEMNHLIDFLQFKTPQNLLVAKKSIYTIYSS
jgi:hypothetical protein